VRGQSTGSGQAGRELRPVMPEAVASIVDVHRHLAPGVPLVQTRGDSTSTLPEDLLREQCVRIQMLHAVGVLLWAINFVMDISLAPHGDRGPYRLVIEAAGAVMAAAAACYTRFGPASARTKI